MTTDNIPLAPPVRTSRMVWIAIAFLGVTNILMLGYLWTNHRPDAPVGRPGPEHPGQFPGRQPGPRAFESIANAANMNQAQRTQYAALRDIHRKAADTLRAQLGAERSALFSHLATDAPAVSENRLNTIAGLQKRIDSITIQHFRQVRALLQPDQQAGFDGVIEQAARMINAGRPEQPQGPPPGTPAPPPPPEGAAPPPPPEGAAPPPPPEGAAPPRRP